MQLFKRRWLPTLLVGFAIGIAIALITALFGRGSFGQLIINLIFAIWGIPILLIMGIVAGIFWWRKGWIWAARLTRWAIALILGALIQLSGVLLGFHLANTDIDQAKAFCERLVPQLQTYRNTHGQYPRAIADLGDLPTLPHLLRGESFYYVDDDSFSFVVEDPTAILGAWQYDSQNNQWQYLD